MTIQDGNPKEIKATIDPVSVAQVLRQMQQMEQPAAKKEPRFQKRVQTLLQSGAVDKDNLADLTSLIEDKAADLVDQLAEKQSQGSVQSMQSRYKEAISDALSTYTDGDEQLEYGSPLIQENAFKKLAADPTVVAKFNAGEVDKAAIKKATKEAAEEFSQKVLKRDKQSKGPAINSTVPGRAASEAIENSPPAGTIDDITEPHRREAYHKYNALLQRNRVSKEDAHKKAYAMATKQYKRGGSSA